MWLEVSATTSAKDSQNTTHTHTNYLIYVLNGLPWAASHGWTARCLIQHSAQQSPELLLPPQGWGYIRSALTRAHCPAETRCCSSLPLLVTMALDQTSLGSLWQMQEDTFSEVNGLGSFLFSGAVGSRLFGLSSKGWFFNPVLRARLGWALASLTVNAVPTRSKGFQVPWAEGTTHTCLMVWVLSWQTKSWLPSRAILWGTQQWLHMHQNGLNHTLPS